VAFSPLRRTKTIFSFLINPLQTGLEASPAFRQGIFTIDEAAARRPVE
jgi:hypothetical protein